VLYVLVETLRERGGRKRKIELPPVPAAP